MTVRSLIHVGLTALALAGLAGCAPPAEPGRMRVDSSIAPAGYPAPLRGAICVGRVSGGDAPNGRGGLNVGNRDFERALSDSLETAGLLASGRANCRYTVDATIVGLSRPDISFEIEVNATVAYRVTATGRPVLMQEAFTSRFAAGFSDSAVGATRLQRAYEGAIRANILNFLEKLRATTPGR